MGSLGDLFVKLVNYDKEVTFEDLSSSKGFCNQEEILRIYRSGGEIIKLRDQNFINLRG